MELPETLAIGDVSIEGQALRQNDRRRTTNSIGWAERASLAFAILGIIAAIASAFTASDRKGQPEPTPPSQWLTPVLIAFLIAVAIAVVAVAWLAAHSAIRRRERRKDVVELLISKGGEVEETGFSTPAQQLYVNMVEQYSKSLVDAARQAFERDGSDVVSQRHVQRAAEFLGTGSVSRRGRHIGAIGGVLLGTGLSVWSDILIDKKYNPAALVISLTVSLIGVAFVVYNWLKD
ncbi:hypothetical protein ACN26Z_03490 [Verrucosispora sp. WMMD703]|uniref:hypothetical protein n=1 Tax=unclassified Micromonospora TaxID=2617518 RepID=UPI00249CC121|nr:hypothetical protein [Verrucosispora sp. WMMD1129]WFE45475.1 hypothetical protein O7624_14500 [Verrucosispora sp. WMMD1129]